MAGAGFKTFVANAVLTATEVNEYLMQQAVPVFASDAARDAAITSPSDGMTCRLTDGNQRLSYYDGSAWQRWDLEARTYTPTWGGSIANPTYGTSTVTGDYWQHGDLWTVRIGLTLAAGFTNGGGNYSFDMPAGAPSLSHANFGGWARLRDVSASPTVNEIFPMHPFPLSATTFNFTFYDFTAGTPAQALWDSATPATLATTDVFVCEVTVKG